MTVDLIQMIADKNNLHDVDTWMIFKWVFKSAAAILIVTNTDVYKRQVCYHPAGCGAFWNPGGTKRDVCLPLPC